MGQKILSELGKNTLPSAEHATLEGMSDAEKGWAVLKSGKLFSLAGWREVGDVTIMEGPSAGFRWLFTDAASITAEAGQTPKVLEASDGKVK